MLDQDGRVVSPWRSCENIDGFDDVTEIRFDKKKKLMMGGGDCEAITFSGSTNLEKDAIQVPDIYLFASVHPEYIVTIRATPSSFLS